jgi:hypothetical protein
MKYLSHYMEKKQSELLKSTGTFFAFDERQFLEKRIEGTKYSDMGMGMYTPKQSAKRVVKELRKIYTGGIKRDLKENGKNNIILRELINHEAFYVGNINDTIDKLKDYPGITTKDIKIIYLKNFRKHTE